MGYELIIKPDAELDIERSRDWYDDKEVGLGHRFLDDLEMKILKVQQNPYHYQVRYKEIRMAFLDIFTDAIHYTVEEKLVFVHAVLGTSRDPNLWVSVD